MMTGLAPGAVVEYTRTVIPGLLVTLGLAGLASGYLTATR